MVKSELCVSILSKKITGVRVIAVEYMKKTLSSQRRGRMCLGALLIIVLAPQCYMQPEHGKGTLKRSFIYLWSLQTGSPYGFRTGMQSGVLVLG